MMPSVNNKRANAESCDRVASSLKETHVEHLLPHGGRVRRALIGQQPFGDGAAGGDLVIFIKRAEKENEALERGTHAGRVERGGFVL